MSRQPAAMPRTVEVIARGIAEGLHLGVQVYASVGGVPAADLALGEARPGVALAPTASCCGCPRASRWPRWRSRSSGSGARSRWTIRSRGSSPSSARTARSG